MAALTPLLMAAVAVAGALLILLGVSEFADISAYSVNVITMLGLGLAVDYSLLVISRFREERGGGLELPRRSSGPGHGRAHGRLLRADRGRPVRAAGLRRSFLRLLAWGGIGVALVAMVAAVTLVPALLGLWGRRIRPGPAHASDRGVFYRLSRLVQRFAPVIVVVVAALLVLLALPFRHARLENSGLESLPAPRSRGSCSRRSTTASRAAAPTRWWSWSNRPRQPAGRRLPAPGPALVEWPGSSPALGHPAADHRARRHPRGHQRGAGGDPAGGADPRPGAAGGGRGHRAGRLPGRLPRLADLRLPYALA